MMAQFLHLACQGGGSHVCIRVSNATARHLLHPFTVQE